MRIENDDKAFETAVELAKAVLANPSNKCSGDANSANGLADFIETLYKRFTGQTEVSE